MSNNLRKFENSRTKSGFKKTAFYRVLRSLFMPIRLLRSKVKSNIKTLYLRIKYRNNSFDKEFEWDWKATNFNRVAAVNMLVSKIPDCSYLEIGCADHVLFNSVPVLSKVGVDPANGNHVNLTSDEFFATNKSLFDVIFIDGLHTYEQVRKDLVNSMRFLKPGGWIALHDMLPRTWKEQHVPVIVVNETWTGDVWKVAFELAQTAGIDFKILKIDYGVGVLKIINREPSLANLSAELNEKQFEYFYENISKLPLVEWTDCQDWLNSRPSRDVA